MGSTLRELLNRQPSETHPDIQPAETDLPIDCNKPSKTEIRTTITALKNGKAAGSDEIPAEAIKADAETAFNILHKEDMGGRTFRRDGKKASFLSCQRQVI